MKTLCVVGSLNVDLTIRLPRFHLPGETITAKTLDTYPGGKGGNQAVAAARLGKPTLMVGILGEDNNGDFYRSALAENGVDARCVGSSRELPTGTAIIEVDDRGENRIAILPGTNALLDIAYAQSVLDPILRRDICMMQFEIDIGTVCYIARALREAGKMVILDPAPAAPAPDELYRNVDYITPNATELSMLSGLPVTTDADVKKAARALLARGMKAVIAKLGERGCMYVDATEAYAVPGFAVETVDTTAAGDSFNAGLAVALSEGKAMRDALVFANAVGALSTSGAGAQSSMPTMAQVEAFLASR